MRSKARGLRRRQIEGETTTEGRLKEGLMRRRRRRRRRRQEAEESQQQYVNNNSAAAAAELEERRGPELAAASSLNNRRQQAVEESQQQEQHINNNRAAAAASSLNNRRRQAAEESQQQEQHINNNRAAAADLEEERWREMAAAPWSSLNYNNNGRRRIVPVIVHTVPPTIICAQPHTFMHVVQSLTGSDATFRRLHHHHQHRQLHSTQSSCTCIIPHDHDAHESPPHLSVADSGPFPCSAADSGAFSPSAAPDSAAFPPSAAPDSGAFSPPAASAPIHSGSPRPPFVSSAPDGTYSDSCARSALLQNHDVLIASSPDLDRMNRPLNESHQNHIIVSMGAAGSGVVVRHDERSELDLGGENDDDSLKHINRIAGESETDRIRSGDHDDIEVLIGAGDPPNSMEDSNSCCSCSSLICEMNENAGSSTEPHEFQSSHHSNPVANCRRIAGLAVDVDMPYSPGHPTASPDPSHPLTHHASPDQIHRLSAQSTASIAGAGVASSSTNTNASQFPSTIVTPHVSHGNHGTTPSDSSNHHHYRRPLRQCHVPEVSDYHSHVQLETMRIPDDNYDTISLQSLLSSFYDE